MLGSAHIIWFSGDSVVTLTLWHVSSKVEWSIHHDACKVAKAAAISLQPGCHILFDFTRAAMEVQY